MQELTVQSIKNKIEPMVHDKTAREEFSQRLAQACSKAGIAAYGRQAKLAAMMKLTPKAVSKWFNGESIPGKENLKELATALGTTSAYLAGYVDDDGIIKDHIKDSRNYYRVDVLDVQASAGDGALVSTDFVERIRAIEYTNEQAKSMFGSRPAESVKVITVRGDSMEGTINPGDEIFVDMGVTQFDGDGVYVFVFGKTLHVKRLQMQRNRLSVLSDNPAYKEWFIEDGDEDQFYIMAKVLMRQSIDYKRFG